MEPATVMGGIGLMLKALKKASELAKDHKDAAVKEQINAVYDEMLEWKAAVSDVITDINAENSALKNRLQIRNARQDEKFGYAYLEDNVPLCQKCLYGDGKRVPLDPLKKFDSGREVRQCPVCNKTYVEKEGAHADVVLPHRSEWISGASSYWH